MTGSEIHIATRRDYHQIVRIRAQWLDNFVQAHPAEDRRCPAQCPVPEMEDEKSLLVEYLSAGNGRWAAVIGPRKSPDGYILCRTDRDKGELWIEKHTPRADQGPALADLGGELVEFVKRRGTEEGLRSARMHVHGFPDEVDPLVSLFRGHGFEHDGGCFRREMVSDRLDVNPGPQRLEFRSAAEIGEDAACDVERRFCDWSMQQARENLESSRGMWSVPDSDWLVAYEGKDPVGTVRMAVSREGVGVVDAIGLLEGYRGRGLGVHLLAAGLSRLAGKTDVVWLDVDEDNAPAVRVYERAGFRVHHHHGGMTAALTSG